MALRLVKGYALLRKVVYSAKISFDRDYKKRRTGVRLFLFDVAV